MRIVHKIMMSTSKNTAISEFERMGLTPEPLPSVVFFTIEESDERWPEIVSLIKKHDVFDSPRTQFTRTELKTSYYVNVYSSWFHGFPQPQDDFKYLAVTYDKTAYCYSCGIGVPQVSPFRFKAEPKWGKRSFLQVNWVFDEYFVKPEVWETLFKPIGVPRIPVLHYRTGKELETVVQLNITEKVNLKLDNVQFIVCPKCGVKKYRPIIRGWYPSPLQAPTSPIFRSSEYFGDGCQAFNAILMKNEFYSAIQSAKLKGLEFAPCR